ncbi:YraN family protein [Flavicella sp.]|uniref:YraN family protein n=1 Tax=Flavicella sp. TaxID=2957742 RepID=UPI00301A1400
MADHNDFGIQGEIIARNYLVKKEYKILAQNWRYRKAEIDIIAIKKNDLAIVEVKTRSSDYYGKPQDFINTKKIQLLVEAANAYVIKNNLDVEVRFDIIAIIGKNENFKIEHFENAFLYF